MVIRSHGSACPIDPLSAILLLRRKDPPCSDPGKLALPGLLPVSSCAVPLLPATLFLWWCPQCPQCPQCPSCPVSPVQPCPSLSPSASGPLAPPASFPPRFHHLLLFEPSPALKLWFARQHYSLPSCPFPATLLCLHHIKSISGPDRVGPRCAIAMFYFGPAQQEEIQIYLGTRRFEFPKAVRRPTCPTHDNSPSW